MANYLSNEQIYQLTDAIVSGDLAVPGTREALLANIHQGYAASLPVHTNILSQLESDLIEMNGVHYLIGYEVPLRVWLENGVHRLRRYARPEQSTFQAALDEVSIKSEILIAEAQGEASPQGEPEELEQIIHKDDLLPVGWLRGAMRVGQSVARVVTPRYENGRLAPPIPGSTESPTYLGTGWLIGQEYVITNHHVVNARSKGEGKAEEADLHKQAEHTIVQFDYDDEHTNCVVAEVEALSAWVALDASPALDYAILKLREPSTRPALVLAPSALEQAEQDTLPVNIIQHPGGNPKEIGIRNNLVSSLEDWELCYFTDTMRGSSGSPVCNDDWHVVALHRATRRAQRRLNFQGKPTAYVNQGVRIDRIIDDLTEHHSDLWTAMAVTVI